MSAKSPTKVKAGKTENLTNAGKGRPKGAVNKTTALLKDAILQAAQAAGGGGKEGMVAYLTQQASDNPGPFMTLLGKVLPMQVIGDDDNPLKIVTRIELVDMRGND
jgi:hypothetical protein